MLAHRELEWITLEGVIDVDAVLVLNVGASTTRIGAVDRGLNLIRQIKIDTRPNNYLGSMHRIGQQISQLHFECSQLDGIDLNLVGAGACVAGCLKNGVITGSGNLIDWRGKNFGRSLQDMFGRNFPAVAVLNDCQAEALGEFTAYNQPLHYIGWGTGIGIAGVTIQQDGRPYSRPTELGHMVIDRVSDLQCGCGGLGHLEALIGGTNLKQRFGVDWWDMNRLQWESVLDDLSIGCNNLALGDSENPMPVVIGGGIGYKRLSPEGANELPKLQRLVNSHRTTMQPPKVLLAQYGEDSGLIGAAHAAWQQVDAKQAALVS
ncbi:hypothetical protein CYG49_02305 [Candidatus Saccharibacteria bacterium]|nr:MAG: hypothetical protein CYG49_02305 [Candidatus Saccharibacteria bacterium]